MARRTRGRHMQGRELDREMLDQDEIMTERDLGIFDVNFDKLLDAARRHGDFDELPDRNLRIDWGAVVPDLPLDRKQNVDTFDDFRIIARLCRL
jgi:hypothetical protein